MAKKLSACLLVVFVLTQMCSAFVVGAYTENFDSYEVGDAITDVAGGSGSNLFTIVADPHGEGNALEFKSSSPTPHSSATISFPAVTGNVVDVSFRISLAGDGSTSSSGGSSFAPGIAYRVRDDQYDIASVVTAVIDSKGNYFHTGETAAQYNPGVVALQAPGLKGQENYCRANGNVAATGLVPFASWVRTTHYQLSPWWYVRFQINFETKRLDAYYNTAGPITDEMIETKTGLTKYFTGVVFQEEGAEKVDSLYIQVRDISKPRHLMFDQLVVKGDGGEEEPAVYAIDASSAAYSVSGNTVSVQADITKGEGAAEAFAVAYDADHNLIGMSEVAAINADMTFDETITVASGTVASVKVFAWNGVQPVCKSVVCTLN